MKNLADIPPEQIRDGWIVRTRDGSPPAHARGCDLDALRALFNDRREGDKFYLVPPVKVDLMKPLPMTVMRTEAAFSMSSMARYGLAMPPVETAESRRQREEAERARLRRLRDEQQIQVDRFAMLELDPEEEPCP